MQIINLAGWQIHTPPFQLEHTLCYGYWLKADHATLQASVDAYLNEGLPDTICYKVLTGQVLASLVDIGHLDCALPPQSDQGWMQERDFAFFVILARLERVDGIWLPRQLVMLPVFLMVDNPLAVSTGREVYGFPKSVAQITIPNEGSNDPVSVTTLALKTYTPNTLLSPLEIIRVTSDSPAPAVGAPNADSAPENTTWDSAEEWLQNLFAHAFHGVEDILVEGLETVVKWVDHMRAPQVMLVYRKQFPDVVDPTQACYSAIIEAPLKVTGFSHGGLLHGNYTVEIEPADSLPIASFLGLPSQSNPVELAFYSHADFEAELGTVIHRFA